MKNNLYLCKIIMQLIKKCFLLGFLLSFISAVSYGQFSSGKVDVNNITDEQILSYAKQYNFDSYSEQSLSLQAKAAGIDIGTFNFLYQRYQKLKQGNTNKTKSDNSPNFTESSISEQDFQTKPKFGNRQSKLSLPIFGNFIFNQDYNDLNNSQNSPAPKNYVLHNQDELIIDIFGLADNRTLLPIDNEGNIRYPNFGVIKVAGLTIEECEAKLKSLLKKIYIGLTDGSAKLKITLNKTHGVRVKVVGQVYFPGVYLISNFGTIINALYLAGGPNDNGTYRNIYLIRNGKRIVDFDLYDFILQGDLSKNLILEDEDIILINNYKERIVITGAVNNPTYFELKGGENLEQVINLSGGLMSNAFKKAIEVFRAGDLHLEINTVVSNEYSNFILNNGDSIFVNKIYAQVLNQVIIDGAVFVSGNFDVKKCSNFFDLITFSGLKPSAYLNRALLYRLNKKTQIYEIKEVNLNDINQHKTNVELQPGDSVFIFDYSDLEEDKDVQIIGEVNNPAKYNYFSGMKINDLILLAGGFSIGASIYNIEVSRRIRQQNELKTEDYSTIFKFSTDTLIDGVTNHLEFELEPFDIITIRKMPFYQNQKTVTIKGEVLFPGQYTIKNSKFKITDLLKNAGGLLTEAYIEGTSLYRKTASDDVNQNKSSNKLKKDIFIKNSQTDLKNTNLDSTAIKAVYEDLESSTVGIHLEKILKDSNSAENLILEDQDVIVVPKKSYIVNVLGAVNSPKKILYHQNMKFKDAIYLAGGYSYKASKSHSFIIYPNGEVKSTKKFLFFNVHPKVKPGSQILVLFSPENRLSPTEKLALYSAITSFGILTISLLNYINGLTK